MKYELSTLLQRFLSLIIDEIFLNIINLLFGLIANNGSEVFIISLFYSLFYSFYFIYSHTKYGNTIGKKIMSIKVVDATTLEKINYTQAIKRDGLLLFCDLLLLLYLLLFRTTNNIEIINENYTIISGYFSILWMLIEITTLSMNRGKRSFSDILGSTIVIQTK